MLSMVLAADTGVGYFAGLLVSLIFGAICNRVAAGKGRHTIAWFLLGFFFTCIALIVLLILPRRQPEPQYYG